MKRHDAKYYWDKYHLAEEAWYHALDALSADSKPTLVGELLAVHKLMDILKECAEKHESHDAQHDNPGRHNPGERGAGSWPSTEARV